MKEIERKFLIDLSKFKPTTKGLSCLQGYILSTPQKSLRVRIMDQTAWLTVKAWVSGITRDEFEYPIPLDDAQLMLKHLCQGQIIEKTRYKDSHLGQNWDIDIFKGPNDGLAIAEIELKSPTQQITLPDWIIREVTDDPRYLNINLSKKPFSTF